MNFQGAKPDAEQTDSGGRSGRSFAPLWCAAVPILFMVYALSAYPTVRMAEWAGFAHEPWFERTMNFVYHPLIRLSDDVPWVAQFYDWYGSLFE